MACQRWAEREISHGRRGSIKSKLIELLLDKNRRAMWRALTFAALLGIVLCPALGEETTKPSGSGSGFFITPDGCFLTNYHVIEGSNKIQVQVGDKLYNAKIIKTDPANDIAILKTEGQFVPLSIGAANQSHIGDDVFTIGFPAPLIQGFAPKLTKGSINAASGLQDDPRFFQISIPVQPGNSGGPLVDERGNVVGIVTSTLPPAIALSEGFIPQNVNYAIKATYAMPLIDSVPDIRDKLVSPITITTRTAVQLREATQQGVGLVLVYTLSSDNAPNVRTSAPVPARRRPEKSWDRPHIYVQLADESQRQAAVALRKQLVKLGYVVVGIENSSGNKDIPAEVSELRFFAVEDSPEAQRIAHEVQEFFAQTGIYADLPEGMPYVSHARQYEIWFSSTYR